MCIIRNQWNEDFGFEETLNNFLPEPESNVLTLDNRLNYLRERTIYSKHATQCDSPKHSLMVEKIT